LPAIGHSRNNTNLWLTSAFGGNGIAFAALAGELISASFSGKPDDDAPCFDPYRFEWIVLPTIRHRTVSRASGMPVERRFVTPNPSH
jgi:glycine/D-amino acid oxidase-like deaminating enzyme